MERYEQLGYSVVETIISGIYIFSISKLLKNKSGIRQRRVLRDLIYVNITVIACDIVLVTLTFTNQVDVSLAVQDFSYMLKLKLEFVVLNQLMAVAARGLSGETYAEKRYYHPSSSRDNRSAWSPDNAKHPLASSKRSGDSYQSPEALEMDSYPGGPEIRTPSPVVPRAGLSPPHPIWESQAGGHSEAKRGRHPPGVGIAVSTHSDQDNRKPRANAQSDTQAMLEPPEGFPVEEVSASYSIFLSTITKLDRLLAWLAGPKAINLWERKAKELEAGMMKMRTKSKLDCTCGKIAESLY
ncbi:hypothetical protein MMC20_001791 [Loxospora ochrophaea]|nr:hypothetical protein [Loxospora ochrophaea]